jgi:hypothetical protein
MTATTPAGKVRRTRDPRHGWRIWLDQNPIGYVTQNGAAWVAKDRRGQAIRRGVDRLDTAMGLVHGRYLVQTGHNPRVRELAAELDQVTTRRDEANVRREQLVVEMIDEGARLEDIASAAHISISSVRDLLRKLGVLEPEP